MELPQPSNRKVWSSPQRIERKNKSPTSCSETRRESFPSFFVVAGESFFLAKSSPASWLVASQSREVGETSATTYELSTWSSKTRRKLPSNITRKKRAPLPLGRLAGPLPQQLRREAPLIPFFLSSEARAPDLVALLLFKTWKRAYDQEEKAGILPNFKP